MARTARNIAALTFVGCLLLLLNGAGLYLQHKNNLPWFVGAALAQGVIYLAGVRLVLS